MTMPAGKLDHAVVRLIDEQQIRSLLALYCRAVDRMDRALLESIYHPDASDDHVFYRGSAKGFVEYLFERLPRLSWTMHNIGTTIIDVEGELAHVESYGVAYHGTSLGNGREHIKTLGCRYIDQLERRDGGPWLIADRIVILEWRRDEETADCRAEGIDANYGLRDDRDALYRDGRVHRHRSG
jgi:hypothetical protein